MGVLATEVGDRSPWVILAASADVLLPADRKWCGVIRWETNDGADTASCVVEDASGREVVTFHHDGVTDDYETYAILDTGIQVRGLKVPTMSTGKLLIFPKACAR